MYAILKQRESKTHFKINRADSIIFKIIGAPKKGDRGVSRPSNMELGLKILKGGKNISKWGLFRVFFHENTLKSKFR